ncbi:hypothetical protein L3X38_015000 [Prunus dulcis]|uniref:DYW domain-containing protein n=1 Tax=Prunus dulcis TaxID=3755 RepID=A0AAD4ZIU5_PRUDU|nr:hypothetical protein L3X38_015000 [Prunus dulcis]
MSLPTVTKFVINTTQVNCFKETCLRVLSLCNSRALKEGVCVHSPITKLGLQEDLYLSNNLLSLYAKCFGVEPARHFFDEMPDRDVVSWTGMLSAYVRNGRYDEALESFDSMSISGQCPNEFTLSSVLRSCSLLGDFDYGTRIHAYVIKLGFESNQYLGSTMIDLYAKCGFTDEACKIFRNMDNRDTISWTTIISSLVQAEKFSQALAHYMDMICAGVHPNEFTFVKLLAASYSLGLNYGKLLHAHLIRLGMRLNLVLKTALVNMYSKYQKMEDAIKVSNQTPDYDVLLWTSVISGFTKSLRVTDAIAALREMELSGIVPNNFTYSSILKASSEILSLELGKQIHSRIIKAGLEYDTCAGGALVDMYMKCSDLAEDALEAFRDVTSPSVITWTSLIAGFSEHGFEKDSFQSFAEMRAVGVQPNSFTLSSILRACTGLAAMETGRQLHCYSIKAGLASGISVSNALVDLYGKCGCTDDAYRAFKGISEPDIVSWNGLISGLASTGHISSALSTFDDMRLAGFKPDSITFLLVLFACSHGGLVELGLEHFQSMREKHEIAPQLDHYACLVDLLGRAGRLEDAMEVIMTMPFKPDALIYKTLLGACKSHRNIALGEYVARQGIELDPSDPAFYVLLANLYEESGQPDLAKSTRRVMRERGLKKNPGQCWMEIRNKVHLFNAGDRSHPQINEIHEKVESLITELKNRGNLYQDYEDSSYHSEKLAVAFGLLRTPRNASVRISKNMRICSECHNFIMLVTQFVDREIIVRDGNRLHVFKKGECSCMVAASLQQDEIFHNSDVIVDVL